LIRFEANQYGSFAANTEMNGVDGDDGGVNQELVLSQRVDREELGTGSAGEP